MSTATHKWIGLVAGVIVLAFAAMVLLPSGKDGTSYCLFCGAVQVERERYIAFTTFPLRTVVIEEATVLSEVCRKHGLFAGHTHHWMEAGWYEFNPVRSTWPNLGVVSHGLMNARNPFVAELIDAVATFSDTPAAERLADRALFPSSAGQFAEDLAAIVPLPFSATGSRATFEAAWPRVAAQLERP